MTPHFKREELECKCGCGAMPFTLEAVETLERLRVDFGHPMIINSGYRCSNYNVTVSESGLTGPHTIYSWDNVTVDIRLYGSRVYELLLLAIRQGFTGIGLHQRGPRQFRYVHLDRLWPTDGRQRPWVWTY